MNNAKLIAVFACILEACDCFMSATFEQNLFPEGYEFLWFINVFAFGYFAYKFYKADFSGIKL